MKRHRRRPSPKPRTSPDALERLHPHAAGVDCGSAEHFVAVPPDRDAMPTARSPPSRATCTESQLLNRSSKFLVVARQHAREETNGLDERSAP